MLFRQVLGNHPAVCEMGTVGELQCRYSDVFPHSSGKTATNLMKRETLTIIANAQQLEIQNRLQALLSSQVRDERCTVHTPLLYTHMRAECSASALLGRQVKQHQALDLAAQAGLCER